MGWRCKHRHPLMVTRAGAGCRARCMGCGAQGPVRASLPEAMKALRIVAPAGAARTAPTPEDGRGIPGRPSAASF